MFMDKSTRCSPGSGPSRRALRLPHMRQHRPHSVELAGFGAPRLLFRGQEGIVELEGGKAVALLRGKEGPGDRLADLLRRDCFCALPVSVSSRGSSCSCARASGWSRRGAARGAARLAARRFMKTSITALLGKGAAQQKDPSTSVRDTRSSRCRPLARR